MKITCGSCAAKYTVSDEKVQGKTVKVKCRKCGAVIVVSSTGEVQTTGGAAASGGGAAGADMAYTVSVSDTDQRNMTMPEVIQAYNEGIIDAETFVWAEGMDDWLPLKDVDAIVDSLHEAAASQDASGQDLGATVALDGAAAGDYGSGAGDYGSGAGDFGSTVAMDSGGGLAASSSGGGASETSGGFFGSTGSGAGSASAQASAPAPGGGSENSAIFSLGMLTSKVEEGGANGGGTSEDSGLIDLKALAAGMGGEEEPAEPAAVAATPSDGGLFPLGAPPTAPSISPPSIPAPANQPATSRGLIMVLGGAVVVLGAALVFIMVRDSGPPQDTANTSQTSATPAPTPTPTPAPTPTETAAPEPTASATASASASASASTPKVAARPVPYKPKPGAKPTTGGAPKPTPKPKPPPKTGGCGCAADDLMCQMRCSTK